MSKNFKVIKKDFTTENFNIDKVLIAVAKSADRVMHVFTDDEKNRISSYVEKAISNPENWENEDDDFIYITVPKMHNIVETALDSISSDVAKSYRDYRNYKTSFVEMLDSIYKKSQSIMYIGDKENANSDSTLASTKRCLIYGQLNKELYQKFFLSKEMMQACNDGYIYIHDMVSRRDCINCSLPDIATILKDGFEMGNVWYNEPKTLDTAFDVLGDVILSMSAQQYGRQICRIKTTKPAKGCNTFMYC